MRRIDKEVLRVYEEQRRNPRESLNQYLRRLFGLPTKRGGFPKGKKRHGMRGRMLKS